MRRNMAVMRNDVQRIIDADPWTFTVYRRGRKVPDGETMWTFTGGLKPALSRGVLPLNPTGQPGETGKTRYGWVLLAPYGTPKLLEGDEVRAVHVETEIERDMVVFFCMEYPYKLEALCDERQR